MELSTFVRQAISEVAFGVRAARYDAAEVVSVAPPEMGGVPQLEPSFIEFDIAVTATTVETSDAAQSGKAGASIAVLSAKIGADGIISTSDSNKSELSTVSRIAFKVPIHFNADARLDPKLEKERNSFRDIEARFRGLPLGTQ